LIMGLTFKEYCPDLRNTGVIDVIRELRDYKVQIDFYDPWVNPLEAIQEYEIELASQFIMEAYNGVVIAVAHDQFKEIGAEGVSNYSKSTAVIYDLKYVLPNSAAILRR
jgi:UDP-N-acetyl-D-glucosamine/UDP-N-acetyl-D-galactosamine dehydrogenase